MLKNKLLLVPVLIIAISAFLWGYFSLGLARPSRYQLDDLLQKTLQENQQLKDAVLQAETKINQLNASLKEKEAELQTLGSAQILKQALANAQATITQLTQETEQAKQEKEAIEQGSAKINNRVQGVSSELARALEELKVTKKSLSDLKKQKDVDFQVSQKQKQIQSLQSELDKLKAELSQSQMKLAGLQNQLAARDNELLRISAELKNKSGLLNTQQPSVAQRGLSQQQVDESKRLLDSSKNQIAQLYEILANKEVELSSQKKEAQGLNKQVAELQAKLSALDSEVRIAKPDAQKTRNLETEKLSLEAKYLRAQSDLEKQNDLIAVLSNNLDSLNKKISLQADDRGNLEAQLNQANLAKMSLESELAKQKKSVQDLNDFYAGLKNQMVQFSGLLTDKEAELREKEKRTQDLNTEIAYQQSKVLELERQLEETKERQRNIIENLSQVTNINAELQDKLTGVTKSLGQQDVKKQEDKNKAEQMKRKVEVILMPESSK